MRCGARGEKDGEACVRFDDEGNGEPVLLLHGFPTTRLLCEWAMDAVAPIQAWREPARLFRVLVRQMRASGGQARLAEDDVREVLAPYDGEEGGAKLVRAARALHPRQTLEIMDALRGRRVPALVVWGERDAYLDLDAVGRPLAALLGAELVPLPGGHFVPMECPREVAEAAGRFLALTSRS